MVSQLATQWLIIPRLLMWRSAETRMVSLTGSRSSARHGTVNVVTWKDRAVKHTACWKDRWKKGACVLMDVRGHHLEEGVGKQLALYTLPAPVVTFARVPALVSWCPLVHLWERSRSPLYPQSVETLGAYPTRSASTRWLHRHGVSPGGVPV